MVFLEGRTRRAQAIVEFALGLPVFLLLIFGISQAVLLYQAEAALNQAATDTAHVLAAQSSDGAPGGVYSQADAGALGYLRAALTSLDLGNVAKVEIFSADHSGNPKLASDGVHTSITQSADLSPSAVTTPITLTLDNVYTPAPPATGPACPVDRFYLVDPATSASPNFLSCALPWNGDEWNAATNQNGRHDQRCDEEIVDVRISYSYATVVWPRAIHITLTAEDTAPLEPRQFLGSAAYQASLGQCP